MLTTASEQGAKQSRSLETFGDAIGAAYTTPISGQRKRGTDFNDATHSKGEKRG